MKEDIKILKVEYLNNRLLDHTQMLNFSLDDQTIFFKMMISSNGRRPQKLNMEYLCNHCMDSDSWVLTGELEENLEDILSVALLSPACIISINTWLGQDWGQP